VMRPDELERRLQERLDALGPAPRAELLHVLMLPDFEPKWTGSAIASRSAPGPDLTPRDGLGALFFLRSYLPSCWGSGEEHTDGAPEFVNVSGGPVGTGYERSVSANAPRVITASPVSHATRKGASIGIGPSAARRTSAG
jgi:hypothetical protein